MTGSVGKRQAVLNLFACCDGHDDSQCNVNCLHGSRESSCMMSNGRGESTCQKNVCCRSCPYYDYTKQTVEAHYRERKNMANNFGGIVKAIGDFGYHGWGIDIR